MIFSSMHTARSLSLLAVLSLFPNATRADEKLIQLDNQPRPIGKLEVSADGSTIYAPGSSGKFLVINTADGKIVNQFGVAQGSVPVDLIPLSDGTFIAINGYAAGCVSRYRADGTELVKLVGKGGTKEVLRADNTGWTSPTGGTVDEKAKLIFALDTTVAAKGTPDPAFSRIAVFDFDGKFVRAINPHDNDGVVQKEGRTWYDDIEVDPALKRVYVTARANKELRVFDYEGKFLNAVPGQGPIAVFPDGRVATITDKGLQIYASGLESDFEPGKLIPRSREFDRLGIQDLETDSKGNLYATSSDPTITFVRWPPDLSKSTIVGPSYRRIVVEFPSKPIGTESVSIKARVDGTPPPETLDAWHVMMRPADGSDLRWQSLASKYANDSITFNMPASAPPGLYSVAVKFGAGPIDWSDRARSLHVQGTIVLLPSEKASGSVALLPAAARMAFRAGEAIDLQVVVRHTTAQSRPIKIDLCRGTDVLCSQKVDVNQIAAVSIPSEMTRRLAPGAYILRPQGDDLVSWPMHLNIAPAQVDSPMQRVLYHEFDGEPATTGQATVAADIAERQAYIRQHTRAVHEQGFTRETDRMAGRIAPESGPAHWRRDAAIVDLSDTLLPPAAALGIPAANDQWEAEMYLDEAVRLGLVYDTQLLGHCSSVRFHDRWKPQHVPVIQRVTQWLGRYPSFYGWNWNDEMFFTGYNAGEWTKEDVAWLENLTKEKFANKPRADMLNYATRSMYDYFGAALDEVDPSVHRTATPMWQFPAVEGSYAPTIYAEMSESYTHFLSEGYSAPFLPTHNVEFLRRPGKPVIGVFDNGYGSGDGEVYLKNALLVGFRGVQGVGVEHTKPFEKPGAASAMHLANALVTEFGSILATCPAANEGAILYSYTQDVTEQRNVMGTPHWERVFFLHGISLMAGVPTEITYEEDVIAGHLMDGNKPRVPMLFLVGQTQALPANVVEQIEKFRAAGGKIYYDADSKEFSGGARLPLKMHEIAPLLNEGYAADSLFPLLFPVYERGAKTLRETVGKDRRFPIDTDEPWLSINHLDGGTIQYIGIARETGPYPWGAGAVWSLGAFYNKENLPWLPKTVAITLPSSFDGVIYDAFEHRRIERSNPIKVDLRLIPGRLYALLPKEIGEPSVSAGVSEHRLMMEISVGMPARVPLRIRLNGESGTVTELYRATGADGKLHESIDLPMSSGAWTLEVAELLGGKTTTLTARDESPLPERWLADRPAVEIEREMQIRQLLKTSGGTMLLSAPNKLVKDDVRAALVAAFKTSGIELKTDAELPEKPVKGVVLSLGIYPADGTLSPLLLNAYARGLFRAPLTQDVPGKGRGIVAALFAPRGYEEHSIGVVGGDAEGLGRAIEALIALLSHPATPQPAAAPIPELSIKSAPAKIPAALPGLNDRAGARLDDVLVGADGKHLLVSASGWLKNLAMVDVSGAAPRVVSAQRIGAAPSLGSLWMADNAERFGGAGRYTGPFGEAFEMFDSAGKSEAIAAFGNIGGARHHFGVSPDGNTVLAPGTYGVACFRRDGNAWKESWAIDYWKEFAALDWPVSTDAERIPQFHAYVPRAGDTGLIVFSEMSNQGWVTPVNFGAARLSSVNLADGKEKWRFDVPMMKSLLFPTLHTSPSGKRTLLELQTGSWGKESYRFYNVAEGKAIGQWDSAVKVQSIAIAEETGMIALVFGRRVLEVRNPDGSLVISRIWDDQPMSVAAASDGRGLFIADNGGKLTRLNADGSVAWSKKVGVNLSLAVSGDKVFAAGWDGRLRCFSDGGEERWSLDLTPSLLSDEPMQTVVAADQRVADPVQVRREPTAATAVGSGENLLATGKAKLTLGGTPGWMSGGVLLVKPEQLTNGKRDDVDSPWLHIDEVFWDAGAGRQVYADITFDKPTDVKEIAVFENPAHPESFPSESVVQVWDEANKSWHTAARGVFLNGPSYAYKLDLKGVTKMRYVPWVDYYRNFYTSEIEVR